MVEHGIGADWLGGAVRRLVAMLLMTTPLALLGGATVEAQSLPEGGIVSQGQATINASGATLTVTQKSQNAIIAWDSFSIGNGATANFINGNGATLNRVTGHLPSTIDGALSATGSVYLINPAGVVVGTSGVVRTGGSFVGSTLDISDANFLGGGDLTLRGLSNAAVVNLGHIVSASGDIILSARRVENAGVLDAPEGAVGLLGGYEVLLSDQDVGNGKFAVKLGGDDTSVSHSGTIEAATAELRTNGGNVFALAGNTAGAIKATGVKKEGGRIFLTAGEGGTVAVTQDLVARQEAPAPEVRTAPQPVDRPSHLGGKVFMSGGEVTLGGNIDVAGHNSDGGTVIATAGSALTLAPTATIDASGANGGLILLGGDYQGGATAIRYSSDAISTAQTTTVAQGATIRADGVTGVGGRVVVWSDQHTDFAGTISATGVTRGGDAEVSGMASLSYRGLADLSSGSGNFGNLLLDPYNITISSGQNNGLSGFTATGNDSVINASHLIDQLALSNVTVSTGAGGAQQGSITVAAPLGWSAGTVLTLSASGDISINAPISATGVSAGLALNSGGNYTLGAGASITLPGSSSTFSVNGNAFVLIRNVDQLQAIQLSSATGRYALAVDIDASATSAWNDGAGFTPILRGGLWGFNGEFHGLGHAITGLTINRPDQTGVGLFASLDGGSVRNVGLEDVDIVGKSFVGGLAGSSHSSTISSSYVTGKVHGTSSVYSQTGGLIGRSQQDTILSSYSTATISGSGYVGGLVGNANLGTISNSFATGAVTGSYIYVGGLAGKAEATAVNYSYATGDVSGTDDVGGLFGAYTHYVMAGGGYARNTVTASYATGNVTGEWRVGGLVGYMTEATLSSSYASGNVVGEVYVGGLIGYHSNNHVFTSYARGAVQGDRFVGGLIGYYHSGSAVMNYATGAVTGNTNVGGLFGETAPISSTMVGNRWDKETSGRSNATGNNVFLDGTRVVGLTTAQMQDIANFATNYAGWDFVSTWIPPNKAGQGGDNVAHYPELYALSRAVVTSVASTTVTYGEGSRPDFVVSSFGGYHSATGKTLYKLAEEAVDPDDIIASIVLADPNPGGISTSGHDNAGTYTISPAATNSPIVSSTGIDYRLVVLPGTYTVEKAALAVTAVGQDKFYDGTTAAQVVFSDNRISGDILTIARTAAFNGSDVGVNRSVSVSNIALFGADAANYTVNQSTTAVASITPRAITITAAAGQSKIYGNVDPTLNYTIGGLGLVFGDTLTGALARAAGETVGDYAIGQGSLAASGNYALSFTTGSTFGITPRAITITAAAGQSKIYGNVDPTLNYTIGGLGLVFGDTLTGALAR
ncbi:MBG domain-containing protein, partial [Devosia sp.]|uniref:beta strand repeat-containing protein n=1 Tax=Devosia sp. TaxID=1871048 RepID=UPI001AC54332